MDKVTQSVAANFEESASASEEMSAQTRELPEMVAELAQLVGHTHPTATAVNAPHVAHLHRPAKVPPKAQSGNGKPHSEARPAAHVTKSRLASKDAPASVIPLTDDEVGDF